MTTLHDRLAELADQAPAGGPTPELWGRGRRYGRRRRAAAGCVALAAVVTLLAGVAAWDPVRPGTVQPAQGPSDLRLPDRLHHPDPWAPGTEETGPLGPLVAVLGAERASWTGSAAAVAGVDAEGAYAFLDLANRVGDQLALSPDGRRLAYWYGGPGPAEREDSDYPLVSGVAVLDTVSGETVRHPVADAPLGLDPQGLAWVGDVLWAPIWPYDDVEVSDGGAFSSSSLREVLSWDLASGDQIVHPGVGVATKLGSAPTWEDRFVVLRKRVVSLVAPGAPAEDLARVADRVDGPPRVDPSGARLAFLGDADVSDSNRPEPLLVGDLPGGPDEEIVLRTLPGPDVAELVGWRSEKELVTLRDVPGGGALYESVDVETGERTTLVTTPAESWEPHETFAADALSAPVLDAPTPPDHHDPRVVLAAGLALALVLGLAGLVLRRRRVRA